MATTAATAGRRQRHRGSWPGWLVVLLLGMVHVARAQLTPGSLDAGFTAGTDKTVVALAVQPDGRAVIAGSFTQVNGMVHGNVARLNADGSLDPVFNVFTDADQYGQSVSVITVQSDGKVLLGGRFTQVNGAPRVGLARLNADGSLDPTFNPNVVDLPLTSAYLNAVAVQPDGKVLVGGSFTKVNGVARNHVARLNPDGSLDASFNVSVDYYVSSVAVQPDGRIVLLGSFGKVNGIAHVGAARLNADGSLDASFQADVRGFVAAAVLQPDGKLLLGGTFLQVNGGNMVNLARLNADGSSDGGFTPEVSGRVVALSVSPADGRIVLGGAFQFVNHAARTNLARINADGTLDTGFYASADGGINAAVIALGQTVDGKVLLGGQFTQVNGAAHPNVARLLGGEGTPVSRPVISGAISATAVVGQPFAYAITASNAPFEYFALPLPPGLSMDYVTGRISGTPTTTGTFTLQLFANNAAGAGMGTVVISVLPTPPVQVPVVTSAAGAGGQVGQPFSYQIVATNGPTSYAALGLPDGLSLNAATGLISGTPTAAGSFAITLLAINAGGTGSAPLLLTISAPLVSPVPVFTSIGAGGGIVGRPFAFQVTATNNPTSFSATGLPAGLSLNAATGFISGTPTAAGSFAVSLSATNAAGTGAALLALNITASPVSSPAPVFTSPGNASGVVGQPFTFQVTAMNAPGVFGATGLPAGLNLNITTGTIHGTPTVEGAFPVTLSAVNGGGISTATLLLTIAAAPVRGTAPVITSAAATGALLNQPFTFQVTGTNGPIGFDATGLPSGLVIDHVKGTITGTPSAIGLFPVTLSAGNATGVGTATLLLDVQLPPGSPSIVTVGVDATTISRGAGEVATVTFTRAVGDLSQKLVVHYAVSGPLLGGNDYVTLVGNKKIKAGQATAVIQIQPLPGGAVGKVKLNVVGGTGYVVGAPAKVKVKITD